MNELEILKQKINTEKLPKHIAIIMDGNGRWAQKQNRERTFGHESGVEAVREALEGCTELGVKYLTLYAFSTENWKRPKDEVDALMELLVKSIHAELPALNKNNIRLTAIGNLDLLQKETFDELQKAIANTSKNTGTTLILALSYSSYSEITEAVKRIGRNLIANNIEVEEITPETISSYLYTSEFPDPELLIRTSGEYRLSNFLLWQIAYTELYFTDLLWPEFRKKDLYEAIIDFQKRERRFGMTSQQVQ